MRWSSPLLWLTNKVLWPVVTLLLGLVAFWRRLLGGRAEPRKTVVTAQYLGTLLSAGTQEGVITPQQDVIVRNILQLRGRPLREIMTPLSHVQMLPVDADPQEARREIARSDPRAAAGLRGRPVQRCRESAGPRLPLRRMKAATSASCFDRRCCSTRRPAWTRPSAACRKAPEAWPSSQARKAAPSASSRWTTCCRASSAPSARSSRLRRPGLLDSGNRAV